MSPRSRLLALGALFSTAVLACAELEMTGGDPPLGAPSEAGAGGVGPDDREAPGLAPVANGVILVHAAKIGAFRVCFDSPAMLERQPLPDSQTMPRANVVGVEVGAAVRLDPLPTVPTRAFLYEERLIRDLYFDLPERGPSCDALRRSVGTAAIGIELAIEGEAEFLQRGVGVLALTGCPKNTPSATHSAAECGESWTEEEGNLALRGVPLAATSRVPGTLPTQVVNLSRPLDGRGLVVDFGDLVEQGTFLPITDALPLYGPPTPHAPVELPFDAADAGLRYDEIGFRVRAGAVDGGADAGPDAGLERSYDLARVQKLSAPRDVPSTFYAAASNYVALILGDPDARLEDGGVDERRDLHLLIVPVASPELDGGTESEDTVDAEAP